jgi:hypothetical protein
MIAGKGKRSGRCVIAYRAYGGGGDVADVDWGGVGAGAGIPAGIG